MSLRKLMVTTVAVDTTRGSALGRPSLRKRNLISLDTPFKWYDAPNSPKLLELLVSPALRVLAWEASGMYERKSPRWSGTAGRGRANCFSRSTARTQGVRPNAPTDLPQHTLTVFVGMPLRAATGTSAPACIQVCS